MLISSDETAQKDKGGHGKTPNDGNRHDATKIINDCCQAENASDVKYGREKQSKIP